MLLQVIAEGYELDPKAKHEEAITTMTLTTTVRAQDEKESGSKVSGVADQAHGSLPQVILEGSELYSRVNQEEVITVRTLTTKAEEVRVSGAKAALQGRRFPHGVGEVTHSTSAEDATMEAFFYIEEVGAQSEKDAGPRSQNP